MARFFKFKTTDDLAAEAARLGVELPLSDDLSPLFRPVAIGPLTAANRLAVQPMEGCDGTRDGHPDALTYRRYQRFGAGGAKLIWGEATAISDEGRMNPRQLWINEGTVGDLARMLDDCRKAHAEAVMLFSDYSRDGKDKALKRFAKETLPTLEMHKKKISAIAKKDKVD